MRKNAQAFRARMRIRRRMTGYEEDIVISLEQSAEQK